MLTARDVIAGVLAEHYPSKVFRPGKGLTSVCNCGELVPVSNVLRVSADYAPHRADALIAAGVTVPEPICGATTVRDGVDLTCDSPPGHDGDHCADFGIHWWPWDD